MPKEVQIKISAQDNASPVLKRIGSEAQAMGNTVSQSAERSGQSFQKFSVGAAALGAAVTSAALVMGEFTRAAAEDQANQARLQQSVENTGKAYETYATQIDQAIKKGQQLAFSDDDTRAALVNLNLVTNDTNASLNELGVVMDFARAKGIDLSTASEIVGKVMGGNLGILSRYGIQLDKNATSEQALAAIQQRSAGQSTTYAQTQLGQIDIMKDKWSELTETIGYHAGALSKVLMILPGLTAGYAALGAAVSGLGGAGGLAATGALGAALALLVGGAAAGYSANTQRGGWGDNLFANASIKGAGVANWLVPGNPFNGIQDQFQNLKDGDNLAKISKALFYSPQGSDSDAFYIGQLKESGVLPSGFKGTLADAADYISKAAVATGVSNQGYIANQIGSSSAYVYDPVGQRYVGKGDYPSLQNSRYFAMGGNLTSGATTMNYGGIAGMAQGPTGPGAGYAAWVANNSPHFASPQGGSYLSSAMYGSNLPTYQVGGSGAVANDVSAMGTGKVVYDDATRVAISRNAAEGARQAAMAATTSALDAIKQYSPGLGITLPQTGVGGSVDNRAGMAARAGTANNAAASGFQVAVGNTNAIASQVKQVNDWAMSLINVKDTYGEIDDLVAKGVINQGEYNAAQAAGTSIFASNAAIQQDILKIQADQAPVIADLTAEQQKYYDHIANDLTPAQQGLALAYMDTGEQAKANTALTLAAAAANGELGDIGQQTATNMISAAAEADPYLKSMLEDMGLITVGADGTITVNFDDVKNSNDETGKLIDAVNNLSSILAQAFGIVVTMDDGGSLASLQSIVGLLNKLNGASATYYVNEVHTGISVGSPNGPSINPGPGYGPGGMNGLTAYANGGTAYDPLLPRFANGGTYALVGEVGPEIVKLSRGDQVMPTGASRTQMNRMNRGGQGNTNFYGPVTLVPAGQDAHRAISQAALGEARY